VAAPVGFHWSWRRSRTAADYPARLSRRGSIEVDGRSNTLIVTDVKENIEAIRQLVVILDQPEPQVEIETRIVIATHNFSRDMGAQLSAGVLNLGRGGLANASSLPRPARLLVLVAAPAYPVVRTGIVFLAASPERISRSARWELPRPARSSA